MIETRDFIGKIRGLPSHKLVQKMPKMAQLKQR